ncbi:MAG: hypothetical protein M3T56_01060 [Chloroflexota bacterium]|nr:hypothetical protein [Chloroflexota bacterium]
MTPGANGVRLEAKARLSEAELARDFLNCGDHRNEQSRIAELDRHQGLDMGFRQHHGMNLSFRVRVVDRKHTVVFVNDADAQSAAEHVFAVPVALVATLVVESSPRLAAHGAHD